MKLFKRILTSLFPDDVVNQPINPVSMFISFISSKQFFSVVNRKIIENYKLNLFDVSLDSFDVKLWFWKNITVKHKDIEKYYSYWVVSNFNWYRFYSPWNIWSLVAIICSIYTKDIFKSYDPRYFINFILTVYYLNFVFLSRIKTFPSETDDEINYAFFIEVFFSFYKFSCESNAFKFSTKHFNEIKFKLLQNIQIFFMLFYVYKSYNSIFVNKDLPLKDYYEWLFNEDITKWPSKNISLDYIANHKKYNVTAFFNATEKKLMTTILPADALIKYLLDEEDIFHMVDYVVKPLYSKDKLDLYLSSFLRWDDKLEDFFNYILDYKTFKNSYFSWIKSFISWKYRINSPYEPWVEEELDELMSSIWENQDIQDVKIPEKLKKESATTEKLINFYLTFIWGFWISRWDNFNMRLFRKEILEHFLNNSSANSNFKQDSLYFYWSLLYSYSKNVFYYKFVFDNVRAGKEKFNLPYKSTLEQVYSNKLLTNLFDQNFVSNIIQDINTKDIKLYIQNKNILKEFKSSYWSLVSSCVNLNKEKFIDTVYWDLFWFLDWIQLDWFVDKLSDKDILNLKESIYTLDMFIWLDFISLLRAEWTDLSIKYSNNAILWIFSFLRDNLFWFALYIKFLENQQNIVWKNMKISSLKKIYIMDILWISQDYYFYFEHALDEILNRYDNILLEWINIDENNIYFTLWYENWLNFTHDKEDARIIWDVLWEDIIRFRWFLKNITYYNKKYVIPRD